jgi:hypothetical protein
MIVEFNGKKVMIEDWFKNALDLYLRMNLETGEEEKRTGEVDLAPIIEEQMAGAVLPGAFFGDMPELSESELSEEEAEPGFHVPESYKSVADHSLDRELQELIRKRDNTFQQALLEKIDELGLKDPDVYNKAGIDRRHFSKIRGDINYHPAKRTAIALAVAMSLNLDDTLDLIGRAGYTLSNSSVFDMVIRFCLERGRHDIDQINGLLYELDQPLLTV